MNKNRIKIIAEIGSIHDGSLGNAIKAIEVAKKCGADIVKFQTHLAEFETLKNAPSPPYFKNESRMDYFKRTSFNLEQWKLLYDTCKKNKIGFLSSPFSLEAVDLLEKLNVEEYKIPSGEITNIPLLEKLSKLDKNIYLSSGMSNWDEIGTAVNIFNKKKLCLLQCSSIYPCPPEKVGINVMLEMKKKFNLEVGFSDHTEGVAASISAVANGAIIVEKHFTFSKLMYGSDAKNSLEPKDFEYFCKAVKEAFIILKNPVDKDDLAEYKKMKNTFEKSIVSSKNLNSNHIITIHDLAFKKPGDGISASKYKKIIGKKLNKKVSVNHKFTLRDFS